MTHRVDRRQFFRSAGGGLAAAGLAATGGAPAAAQAPSEKPTDKDKLARIASCSYPIRSIFKAPAGRPASPLSAELKRKYGEITMLDFPQFTKDTFPGVTRMDLFSGLFGDVTDDSMFAGRTFDPSSPSGRKWLDKLAAKMAATGTKLQHISNNAPTNLASSDEALRK